MSDLLPPPPCPETQPDHPEINRVEEGRAVSILRRLVTDALQRRLLTTQDSTEINCFLDALP